MLRLYHFSHVITMWVTNPGDTRQSGIKRTQRQHWQQILCRFVVGVRLHSCFWHRGWLPQVFAVGHGRFWVQSCALQPSEQPLLTRSTVQQISCFYRFFFQQYRTIHWSFGSLLRKIISQLQFQYQQADPITSLVWIIWQQTVNSLWPCRSPQTWKKQNYPSEKQIKLNM